MTNLLVFTVFDSKAGFYKSPFILRSKGEALRAFQDIANDVQSDIGKHPEDFILYLIAEYDELTGVYLPKVHECLGKAIEYVVPKGA
ncbi:MAG: nonstructural protein [Microvirus sp.]|nr:MAG: nonstructural protein [Microvirus sp.]